MLAMNKMIGALLLKLGICCLGLRSRLLGNTSWSFCQASTLGITLRHWIKLILWFFSLVGERRRTCPSTTTPPICRHSRKEKVTMDDLFLLHSMDGGVSVDVPWHVGKFLCDKAKGSKRKSPIAGAHLIGKIASYYGLMTLGSLMNVTLGPETSSMSVAKLVDLGICRYNGLGIGEMVAEILEVARDDDVGAGQAKIGGGVNFMSGTPGYSTTPSPSASQFGMFGDAHPSTSRNQDDMNED
ncbi:hypothetical protein Tco_1316352 [Tanacetum coccineum]